MKITISQEGYNPIIIKSTEGLFDNTVKNRLNKLPENDKNKIIEYAGDFINDMQILTYDLKNVVNKRLQDKMKTLEISKFIGVSIYNVLCSILGKSHFIHLSDLLQYSFSTVVFPNLTSLGDFKDIKDIKSVKTLLNINKHYNLNIKNNFISYSYKINANIPDTVLFGLQTLFFKIVNELEPDIKDVFKKCKTVKLDNLYDIKSYKGTYTGVLDKSVKSYVTGQQMFDISIIDKNEFNKIFKSIL